jgi:hypothetical protein
MACLSSTSRARPDGLPRVLHRLRLHRLHLRLHRLRLHRLRLHRRLRLRLHRLQTEVSSEARQVSDLREDCAWLQRCWDPEHGGPYKCLARLGGSGNDVNAITYSLGTVAGLWALVSCSSSKAQGFDSKLAFYI